jgi:hypothetical protein
MFKSISKYSYDRDVGLIGIRPIQYQNIIVLVNKVRCIICILFQYVYNKVNFYA